MPAMLQVLAPAEPKQPPATKAASSSSQLDPNMVLSCMEDPKIAEDLLDELGATWTKSGGNMAKGQDSDTTDNQSDGGGDNDQEPGEWLQNQGDKKRKRGTKNRGGRKIQLGRMRQLLRTIMSEAGPALPTD